MLTHVHATALCFSLENNVKVSTRTTHLSLSSCAIVENAVGTVHLFYLMLALCSESAVQHRSDAGANFAASIFSSVIYT